MLIENVIKINAPMDSVLKAFMDSENRFVWDKSIVSSRWVEGEPWAAGSKSIIQFKAGKAVHDLEETILESNLPHYIKGFYFHKHTENTMEHFFKAISPNETEYITVVEYTAFKGLVIKIMSKLMPSMFAKQVKKQMGVFKAYMENEYHV